jgi:amino-acid N-acetyltransferase
MQEVIRVTVICRKANLEDLDALVELIQLYAEQGIMLPRSREALMRQLDTFVVADDNGEIVGCGSLLKLGEDLVEIRSLGLMNKYRGQGIGKQIVDYLTELAKLMKVPKIMALTYQVAFFERLGFSVVPKEIFPEKVWKDCIFCKKQHCCDEIAVMKRIDIKTMPNLSE